MRKKITDALVNLTFNEPFYASLALRMQIVEDESCETAYTDGIKIGYNPKLIDELSLAEVKGLLCHEIQHVAHFHHTRMDTRDSTKWNYATDYTINPILLDHGYSLPSWVLNDPRYYNMSPEQIYPLLKDPPGSSGLKGLLDKLKKGDKKDKDNQEVFGEVRPFPSDDKKEVSKHESDMAVAIRSAAMIAKKAGKLPAGMEDFITDLFKEKINWVAVLTRFVNQYIKDTYKWTRPNRRLLWMNTIIPSLAESPTLKDVTCIFDTSGSMNQQDMNIVASEVAAILGSWKDVELRLLYVDAAVQGEQTFKLGDNIRNMQIKGRGGTSYVPGFNYLKDKGVQPTVLIYFTDGWCSSFPDAPDFPVLWIISGRDKFTAPFGEITYYER